MSSVEASEEPTGAAEVTTEALAEITGDLQMALNSIGVVEKVAEALTSQEGAIILDTNNLIEEPQEEITKLKMDKLTKKAIMLAQISLKSIKTIEDKIN